MMPIKLSQSLLILSLFLNTTLAHGIELCLYARANNNPTQGHSFVTVESNGRILETYGYWPDEKHPGYFAINRLDDHPISVILEVMGEISTKMSRMTEKSICGDTGSLGVSEIRAVAQSYYGQFGAWKAQTNNCTHFAIWMLNEVSNVQFPVVMTPRRVVRILTDHGF
jgi:hypothetical protein